MAKSLRMHLFQMASRIYRPMTLGVRGVVTNEAGHVLLVRHTYMPGWHLPGGGVERGERCLNSLERELEEEAGVRPAVPPTLFGVYANHKLFPNDHVMVYRVSRWTACEATSVGEIAERGFYDPASLPDETTTGTIQRVREVLLGEPVSEDWS